MSADVSKIPLITEAMLLAGASLLYAGSVVLPVDMPFSGQIPLLLGLYGAGLFVELKLKTTQRPVRYIPAILRLMIFSTMLWSFTHLYGGWGAATLNAPTMSFFYVLLLLQAFYRDAARILWLGGTAFVCKMVLVWMAAGHGTIAMSYTYYLRSPSINLLAEAEKLAALGLFVGMLYLLIRRQVKVETSLAMRDDST